MAEMKNGTWGKPTQPLNPSVTMRVYVVCSGHCAPDSVILPSLPAFHHDNVIPKPSLDLLVFRARSRTGL
jgi:hypothetical protein